MKPNSAHNLSRRTLISGTALGLTSLALAGCDRAPEPIPAPSLSPTPTPPPVSIAPAIALTTLETRLVAGQRLDPKKPYRRLAAGEGQPLVVREELCKADSQRVGKRRTLTTFGHITDTHILDPTSPAHTILGAFNTKSMENLDRSTYYFRPQEALTVQVMDAMIRRLNEVNRGPVTGQPFDFYISTGDSSDNRGANEVHAFIDVMNGDTATAFAFPGKYNGLQEPLVLPKELAKFIWQPVQPKKSTGSSIWQNQYGFPTVPHILEDASKPVATRGASVPWYSGFGNHDSLVHDGVGNLGTPNEIYYKTLATGDKIPLSLLDDTDFASFMKKLNGSTEPQIKDIQAAIPGRTVEASQQRRPLSKTEFMSAHMINPGPHGPVGHGFTDDNIRGGFAYYRFQIADGIIGLMLDTTDTNGVGYGSLDTHQAAWLKKELMSASATYFDEDGVEKANDTDDQLIVVFSHHPSITFSPKNLPTSNEGDITSPEEIQDLFARFPNVILWISGHLHRNACWPRPSKRMGHGFWEVSTASHIDFPQQSRSMEIIDNMDGSLSLIGVMIDHSEAREIDYSGRFSPADMAVLSLELALNSPRAGVEKSSGRDKDQNVELLLKKPFESPAPTTAATSTATPTAG
ncbi:TIGR03767 family metallophosphoesterase [Arthrobacter psychrolactophilus]|uniref:TIGR03767 family metallophosphoesterase n=1 Tax=Arthrobacter psychrolactophilus TaxID=92442 RepID=A0A2V5IST7_9MICC|nr:TIGR03767 family metallophosphoesterase [Arthrobacter psychrolactophilus]PYI39609.1 TIGR03767 family metallophosphoesterase [Arthrobacter psychrolactophilus]